MRHFANFASITKLSKILYGKSQHYLHEKAKSLKSCNSCNEVYAYAEYLTQRLDNNYNSLY